MDIEDLLQKHRKEKKELQAKIQSLKKTADKKKKKETAELISQLETELKAQQQSELDSLNDKLKDMNCDENEIQDESNNLPAPSERISKAQRRRNKKTQYELENQRRIAEQEIENQHGPRNLELLAINEILKSRNLKLYSIPSDGDCLYQAINHQLEVSGREALGVSKLRNLTCTYMCNHKEEMLPFMITEEGDIMSDEGFNQYCDRIDNTKQWGGQVELTALSNILNCSIHILQASGPATIIGEQFAGSPLVITYHRHMYGLGEHYNSTTASENETCVEQSLS